MIELWGLGDLAIATPFIRGALAGHDVTVLGKPVASQISSVLWPGARVREWTAPWTAFRGKYRLASWPWREIFGLRAWCRRENFTAVVSARHDPRDHLLMFFLGIGRRIGVPRLASGLFLSDSVAAPARLSHRAEWWSAVGRPLGITPLGAAGGGFPTGMKPGRVVIHSGAAQAVRIWPVERYLMVARELARQGFGVKVVCDPQQRQFWERHGDIALAAAGGIEVFLAELGEAMAFIGNDSGPGHLAAAAGVPTFTIFGNQLSEWFRPVHPWGELIEGGACPHKPCFDACRFPAPHCILWVEEGRVLEAVSRFLRGITERLPA